MAINCHHDNYPSVKLVSKTSLKAESENDGKQTDSRECAMPHMLQPPASEVRGQFTSMGTWAA